LPIDLGARLLCLILIWTVTALAERLPIKTYTTADGLAQDNVNCIVRDSRGFLWFCTNEGLSRFDGYQFANYGTADGLPRPTVSGFLETRRGDFWVATTGGLCRFNPKPARGPHGLEPKFVVYRPGPDPKAQNVQALLEDRAGVIWCGTRGGLYRLDSISGRWTFQEVDIGLSKVAPESAPVNALLEDRRGALWIGANNGLYRRRPDGGVEHYTEKQGLPGSVIASLLEDRSGRLWVGVYNKNLCQLVSEPSVDQPIVAHEYAGPALSLFQASDGRIWAGGTGARGWIPLREITPQADSDRVTIRDRSAVLGPPPEIYALTDDREGNLWLGTRTGVIRIARNGFTTYGEADGLELPLAGHLFADQSGEICGAWGTGKGIMLGRFDGRRFALIPFPLPRSIRNYTGWGPNRVLQDHTGEWWIGSGRGLLRFRKISALEQLAHTPPKALYTRNDGLPNDHIFTMHEDAHGDLWIAVSDSPMQDGLCRWNRATGTFRCFTTADGADFLQQDFIYKFGEDRAGQIWMGLFRGGLVRYRQGRFTFLPPGGTVPAAPVWDIYCDHAGRLWIALARGVLRCDDPTAESARFRIYTTEQGLPSNTVESIAENAWGRIYLATWRGVCRLDPVSGRIKLYSRDDGLVESQVRSIVRDRRGALWFNSLSALNRFMPEPERAAAPPSIFIRGLHIAGEAYHVSDLGETAVDGIAMDSDKNSLQVEYAGLPPGPGEAVRYEYKLEGAVQDWQPTTQRIIHYASLRPGSYRFLVRAVDSAGTPSPEPARVGFTIRAPLWQRWWSLTLIALGVGAVSYTAYRYRLAHLLELERVRTRIATDLHDDIGSSLARIAVLSELIQREISGAHPKAGALGHIVAETARGLMEAMSDIVWSIDPRRDDLCNLILRIRDFAADTLEAQGIAWHFQGPAEEESIKLTPEQRRQVYLIVKEAIHNIVSHAGAKSARLTLRLTHHQLVAEVQDDGRGFAMAAASDASRPLRPGYGLGSMQARAAKICGSVQIESQPGRGTCILLSIPLSQKG
jgi:ligand-binding sensor domain-containing protein/anti-sigma regulatory factor (Ser/Thr protein kinase)